MARLSPFLATLVVFASVTPVASAQTSAADKAAAEALFQQALEAMRAGKFEEACPKLEQSGAIDHAIGTSLYLAECYEKSGRTASAWGLFREAASEAQAHGEADRAAMGNRRADRLEPLLSHLTLQVPLGTAAPGLELVRDGRVVPQPVWNVAVPVDPGDHRIVARAPGYQEWSSPVRVDGNGGSASVTVPPLVKLETAPPPAAVAPQPPVSAPAASPPADTGDRTESTGSVQRTLGLVVGGLGVVTLGVGGYFGLRAISKNQDAKTHCDGTVCRDPEGESLSDSANRAARLANVFVIGGGILAVGGVALYLTAPSDRKPSVSVTSNGREARVVLGGSF
ncbi:MAG TPA: hypothetical protein VHE30_17025 [Polyangiaceae bacterium]|nr:hypothetical protein [Polyangiaceae bacterium]